MVLAQRTGRSRYRLALLVLTAATLLTLDFRGFGPLESVQRGVRDIIEPVTSAADVLLGPVGGAWNAVFDYNSLQSENDRLRAELDEVLVDVARTAPACAEADVQDALQQILAIEDELSAPGLSRLSAADRASLFSAVVALFLDPGGNSEETRYSDALNRTLGRWTRRKVRRIVEEVEISAIGTLDHEAWGFELRALAAAQVIDRNGGDLRSVLRALLVLESDPSERPIFEGSNLGTLASTSESVRRLLARITALLCERLERSH